MKLEQWLKKRNDSRPKSKIRRVLKEKVGKQSNAWPLHVAQIVNTEQLQHYIP